MESEFPSNSKQQKIPGGPSPKKVEKVVTGEVRKRSKSLGKRFRETFTVEDSRSVGTYVLFDVLIPSAKEMIVDSVIEGVNRLVFGESRSRSRRGFQGGGVFGQASYRAYNRYSQQRDVPMRAEQILASRKVHADRNTFDEIVLETRAEAKEVLDQMYAILAQYEFVTVADMYELLGITADVPDHNWGWTDLRGSDVEHVNNPPGYLISLPRPQPAPKD